MRFATLASVGLALCAAGVAVPPLAAQGTPAAPTPAAQPVVVAPALKPVNYRADPELLEYAKQAGNLAITEWIQEFLGRPHEAKRFAVLPLGNDVDDGYFTLQTRNEFANQAAGSEFSLYTRDDGEWQALMREIRMGDQEGDTMDADTIQQFGRIQGIQGIIRGRISGVFVGQTPSTGGVRFTDDDRIVQVRVLLQAFEVETGRLLWGREKTAAVLLAHDGVPMRLSRVELIAYVGGGIVLLLLVGLVLRGLKAGSRPR